MDETIKIEEKDPVIKDIIEIEKQEQEAIEIQKIKEQQREASKEDKKENNDDKPKKIKFSTIFVVLIVIGLITAVTFYFLSIKEETYTSETGALVEKINNNYYVYNSFIFSKASDGTWATELLNPQSDTVFVVSLHNDPLSLEDVEIQGDIRGWLNDASNYFTNDSEVGAAYILFDPNIESNQQALAYAELQRNLDRGLKITPYPAVTTEFEDNNIDIPVKECPSNEPTIYLKYNDPSYIFRQGNCIVVQGTGEEIVKSTNRLLYLLYGVMKD